VAGVKSLRDKWLLAPHVAGLAVFAGCQVAVQAFPSLKTSFFCWPAAVVASVFLGVPVTVGHGNEPMLMHGSLDVLVAESCSGFDFFSLLLAVLCGMTLRYRVKSLWCWAGLLPFAFLVSLAGNSARIISAVQVRLFAHSHALILSDDIAHFAVGTAVFATLLTACCYLTRYLYEHDAIRSAHC
jgi:exosortase/archaeosortase family protein